MGQPQPKRILIVSLLLLLLSFIATLGDKHQAQEKSVTLERFLVNIPEWQRRGFSELPQEIVSALELDDYANQNYTNGNEVIDLYIGYYLSAEKIGAAHDPLVCFPGQGWTLDTHETGTIEIPEPSPAIVSYSSMVAARGEQRNLIVYWFQSYDKTAANTFIQKIYSIWQKFLGNPQESAFVRIVVPFGKDHITEANETARRYIQSFYPVFLRYVRNQSPAESPGNAPKSQNLLKKG